MSSIGKIAYRSSLGRGSLGAILGAAVWWASTGALAQVPPTAPSQMTAQSAPWSLEGPGSNTAPHLVIGMLEPGDTPTYHSLRHKEGGTSLSPSDTIFRPANAARSSNRNEKDASGAPVLSSLVTPGAGVQDLTTFPARPASALPTIQTSAGLVGTEPFSLLDDMSASESLLNAHQANYLPLKQWLADNESFASKGEAPAPLVRLEFGGWSLPVTLSDTAVSR